MNKKKVKKLVDKHHNILWQQIRYKDNEFWGEHYHSDLVDNSKAS